MTHQAAAKAVEIDGTKFAVDGGVLVETLRPWAEPLRITGNKTRGDRANANQWVQEDWGAGLGFYTVRGGPDDRPLDPSFFGFYDSAVETRWQGQVTLPGLIQTTAHTNDGTGGNPDHNYYRFFRAALDADDTTIYAMSLTAAQSIAYTTSGTAFPQKKDLTAGYANFLPRCAVEHNGSVYVFGGTASAVPATTIRLDSTGTSADVVPTTNLANTPHSVVSFRDALYAAMSDNAGLIKISKSADDGANWTTQAGMELTYFGRDNCELVVYVDANGSPAVYLIAPDGLYLLDLSGQRLVQVIKFWNTLPGTAAVSDLARPVVWNSNLYIPHGYALIEYNAYSGAWRDISPFTQARTPSKYRAENGQISCLFNADSWLFVGVTAGTTASVWAYDGRGWHYIWSKTGTGTVTLRDITVSKQPTLGYVFYALYTESGDSMLARFQRIEFSLQNPLENSSFKFAASGTLVTPWYDGGMSEVSGPVLAQGMGAASLDTTANNNERIQTEIALNWSETYEAAANRILTWYSDSDNLQQYVAGAGISARSWRHRYTLTRGSTNTKSPVMFYPITYYDKKFADLHRYTMTINLAETAQLNRSRMSDAQDVLDRLEEIHDSGILVTFTYAGTTIHTGGATRYVDMVGFPHVDAPPRSSGSVQSQTPRLDAGQARIVLEERIPA